MAQRTSFAGLPGTAPLAWIPTLTSFLAEMDRSRPGVKGVKEWLRTRNLFDPASWQVLMEMLEVSLGEPVALGRTARDFLEAHDEAAAKAVLARRLVEANPLLAKYCLQALDVEHEGRLHSTNELFRMVTSYVYPGEKPTLTSFKAWVDWAVAAGLLKLVGIRWALGEGAREVLPRLRALDTEEFLEAEREATIGGEAGEPEVEPGTPEPMTPEASPSATKEMQPPVTPAPEGAPSAENPPSGSNPASVPPAVGPVATAPTPSRPAPSPSFPPSQGAFVLPERPGVGRVPTVAPAPGEVPFALVSPALDLEETRRRLRESWTEDPHRPASLALRVGAQDALEAAFAGLLLARGLSPEEVHRAFSFLRDSDLFRGAAAGTLPLAVLASAEAGAADEALLRVLPHLPVLPRLQAGLRDPGLFQGEDAREWLDRVWRRLYAPRDPLAPFWLARLRLGQGMLGEALGPASVVPHYVLRENAFRIGFLDRLHAASFPDLVEAALRLSEGFPVDPAGHPLEGVHLRFGCAFRCPRALVCPLSCRERLEMAPAISGP